MDLVAVFVFTVLFYHVDAQNSPRDYFKGRCHLATAGKKGHSPNWPHKKATDFQICGLFVWPIWLLKESSTHIRPQLPGFFETKLGPSGLAFLVVLLKKVSSCKFST